MKRAGLMVALAVALVGAFAIPAEAQRRHGRTQEATPPPEPTEPNPNMVALMNGLTWGMTKDQVIEAIKLDIKNKYWPQIQAEVDDAVAEQNLRTRMERDQQRFVDTCIEFTGQETPWNVSMIDTEYAHSTQEVMCKYDRGDSTDYLFFIRGKLWKIFRALSSGITGAAMTFDEMRAQMESQFGPGEGVPKVNPYSLAVTTVTVKWRDSATEMQMRWLEIYGVFVIVLAERATEGNLANLRGSALSPGEARAQEMDEGGLTQAVTQGTVVDDNQDVVQRLRGNRPDPTAPQPPTPPPTPSPTPTP